jgi:adenylate cyclase
MAVAGAPQLRLDHVTAGAKMGLAIQESIRGLCWPSGYPVRMRVGIASGPVVAGVIGRRKFSYDLWGDTVNLASRLASHGEPEQILVSEAVAERIADQFLLSPARIVDLKGKGPTPARYLLAMKRALSV